MTQHLSIQNPDDYDAADYQHFEALLFAPGADIESLEQVCMTLAHLPTRQAQELLARFQRSPNACKVTWLECAVDEGQQNYLSANNELEERDMLALKMVQEMEDAIFELEYEYSRERLRQEKLGIRAQAIRALVAEGALDVGHAVGLEDALGLHESRMAELRREIEVEEQIQARIRASIQTERYQTVDPAVMRHCHFDGE